MQNRTEQNRTEQNRTEQNRTEQNRTVYSIIHNHASSLLNKEILTKTAFLLPKFKREIGLSLLGILVLSLLNFCLIGFPFESVFSCLGKGRDFFFTLINFFLVLVLLRNNYNFLPYLLFLVALNSVPLLITVAIPPTELFSVKNSYFILNSAFFVLCINILLGQKGPLYTSLSFVASIFLLLPALTHLFHFCTTGARLYADTLLAIAQTNVTESWEYFWDNAGPGLLVFIGATVSLITLFFKTQPFLPSRSAVTSALIILSCIIVYKTIENVTFFPFIKAHQGAKEYAEFSNLAKNRMANLNLSDIINQGEDGFFVFIIGESQSRDHMHCYGYERQTTPWLSSCRHNENFIFFTNAYSNHTHTVPTLSLSLTAKNQYNTLPLIKSPSVIDLANASGYETFWISNQVKVGIYDTPTSVIASQAHQQFWLNKNMGATTETNFFDSILLEQLMKTDFHSPKTFVILHLMGSHGSYAQRYPNEFNAFGTSVVDTYDTSVLYTDNVVKGIYEFFSVKKGFKALIYMSDHADAVKKNLGHDSSRFDFDMTHIPLWIAFGPEYLEKNSVKVHILKKNADVPFTNDLMFELLLGLMDIRNTPYYNALFDIGSEKFSLKPEELKTLHGKRTLIEDPMLSSAYSVR